MIELSTDENEIKTITLKVTEQEFRIIQIKKSIKNYKKEMLDLSPKNSEVLSATSKSGSSKKETKNAENDIKSEADIKSNSNYSSTSASNTPYFNLQESELSPDYFKTLTEKTEINTTEKLKLLEQQYDAAKNIILSDAHDEYENKQPFEFPKEFSELETKPNNNPSPPNVIEKQKDTVLKRSNAKQIHSPTFDFPKQKTKLTSKHFENPIPKIYLNENPTKNDPNNKKQISKISVDSFPDKLVEFEETVTSKGNDFLSAQQVLQREFESQNLPPIELKRFDGNPELWPEFIENFYSRVHRMASFDNNLKMDRLLSVLDGDAKRSIQSIGSSGIFYATALKALKRDYGNPIIVSHLRVKSLFAFPPIKSNDRTALRNFHQKLKVTITWLNSIGHEVPIKSKENLAKALLCLPYNMRNEFYKVTCNLDILDGDPNLIFFEKYLVFEKYFLEKYFLIPLPMSLPHKELKQIINTKKKKIKKGNKLIHFTILH